MQTHESTVTFQFKKTTAANYFCKYIYIAVKITGCVNRCCSLQYRHALFAL